MLGNRPQGQRVGYAQPFQKRQQQEPILPNRPQEPRLGYARPFQKQQQQGGQQQQRKHQQQQQPAVIGQDVKDFLNKIESIQHYMREPKFKLDACQLGYPGLTLTKVLSNQAKGSASSTIIAFGKILDQEVVCKISFQERNVNEDNSLAAERIIYQKLIPAMLQYTPHLMYVDYVSTCPTWWTQRQSRSTNNSYIGRELINATAAMMSQDQDNKFNYDQCYFLITEKARGLNLSDWIKLMANEKWAPERSETFLKMVLFQIAYTLSVFEQFGFLHNDLHDGNVFVEKTVQPITIHYQVSPNIIYHFTTNLFVRIYDFDHSVKQKRSKRLDGVEIKNTLIEKLCKVGGECENFQKSWDWFTIIVYIYSNMLSSYKQKGLPPPASCLQLIEAIIPKNVLQQQLNISQQLKEGSNRTGQAVWLGHACLCRDSTCTQCQVQKDTLDKNVMSCNNFLTTNWLMPFKVPVPPPAHLARTYSLV